ncbi:hypothetical protein [Ureaplasma zalophigenitalium]|uniref:Bax inhibitor-1/YccA family protein n=1 Tax=Ureaplasma zalophigenitalium TaxID=907723 RepID=A0ABT3BPD3_9BACT|nr:hypothetical protein [Ureaplasma zalophigenitalium]MCV3753972.1 hypothetical protein [Ureaplasma zalophigenitalium]
MNFWKVQKEPLNQKQTKLVVRVLGLSLLQTLVFTALLIGLVFLFQYGIFYFNLTILLITYGGIAGINLLGLFIMFLINLFTNKFQYNFAFNIFYTIFLTLGYSFLLALMIGYLNYYTFLIILALSLLIYSVMLIVGFLISRKGVLVLQWISTVAIIGGLILLAIGFLVYFLGFNQSNHRSGWKVIDLIVSIAFCIGITLSLIINISHVKITCQINPDSQHKGFMLHLSNTLYRAYIQVVFWIFVIFIKIRRFFH